jgi:citrate synthase
METITTQFWQEIAEADNPFAAAQCRCAGFDVYGDMLPNAGWIEYLYLLFQGNPPNSRQAQLLNALAVALANPGPRDLSVQAAMSAAAGGSHQAAALMSALAVGAGSFGGARELLEAMKFWHRAGTDLNKWKALISHSPPTNAVAVAVEKVWLPMEHPPGFDAYARNCNTPVRQTLDHLASLNCGEHLIWLQQQRTNLETLVNHPLSLTGVAAAAFTDLDFDPEQGEMLYLLLRLPGAAAHAVEQTRLGWRNYPFHGAELTVTNDPANPDARSHTP